MELLEHSSRKSEKLWFVGWVMGLHLGQTPASIGDDGISPVIMGLVENSPQARPAFIGVQFEGPRKVGIGQNRHYGTYALHFMKRLLVSGIPSDACPLCTCILSDINACRGWIICMNQGIIW